MPSRGGRRPAAGNGHGRGRGEANEAIAVWQPQCTPVRAIVDLLTTGHSGGGQMPQNSLIGERRADRQAQRHASGEAGLTGEPGRCAVAHCRRVVPQTEWMVSLNWRMLENPAANATSLSASAVVLMSIRGSAFAGHGPKRVGQHRLRPAAASSVGVWCTPPAGLDLRRPHDLQCRHLSGAWRGRRRRRAHSTPENPGRRRDGIVCMPETVPLRGRGCGMEPQVAGEWCTSRATGPAIYPGGQHRGDKPTVEPGISGLDGPIAAVEIFVHA
ncbi:hypothetical protein I553_3290 [Mycobacterium xenopi 4042]|uniref:Uncharacterized protein n=1 Tax=Mycobacterium xenopi 4042 TaxID=1299334 RepID=X8E3D5_MYCXE|nr:hypothetical protein I553_3290 [Mycobacterium xenopi 4042]